MMIMMISTFLFGQLNLALTPVKIPLLAESTVIAIIGTEIIPVNDADTVEIIIDEITVDTYRILILFLLRFNLINSCLQSSNLLIKYCLTFSEILCSSTIYI